jgi:hypothetical protein
VLDETGDVVLVFDDEDAVLGHDPHDTVPVPDFAIVTKPLNLG